MDFDEYQKEARETAVYPKLGNTGGRCDRILYPVLGLCGEAGEVCEKVKKIFRDNNGIINFDKEEELIKELGDVLWYLANIAMELNISFSFIAKKNIEKLQSRKDRNKISGSGDNR